MLITVDTPGVENFKNMCDDKLEQISGSRDPVSKEEARRILRIVQEEQGYDASCLPFFLSHWPDGNQTLGYVDAWHGNVQINNFYHNPILGTDVVVKKDMILFSTTLCPSPGYSRTLPKETKLIEVSLSDEEDLIVLRCCVPHRISGTKGVAIRWDGYRGRDSFWDVNCDIVNSCEVRDKDGKCKRLNIFGIEKVVH